VGEITPFLKVTLFQVSHEQTQPFGATFGTKLGTSGCEASLDRYGKQLKGLEG